MAAAVTALLPSATLFAVPTTAPLPIATPLDTDALAFGPNAIELTPVAPLLL